MSAPFDRSLHPKLILEHYYDPPTFQPDMPSGGPNPGDGIADAWGTELVTMVMA